METKFTPGPWIFYADLPSTEPNWHLVTTANKLRVLANVHIEPRSAMDLANARLIAAAPELFEALEWALRQIDVVMIETEAAQQRYDAARAALAKATGEQA